MSRIVSTLMILAGMLLALFGIGADHLLPGASPGYSLPQIMVFACGSLLATGGIRWRRTGIPSLPKTIARKHGARIVAVSLVTLLLLEIILTVLGKPTYYPAEISNEPLDIVPWWACDEQGCRYVPDAVERACANGELQGRYCVVNEQGYADRKDFTIAPPPGAYKILFLGDSFTFGMTADLGKSYVETVERLLPDAVVWNAAIPATGTNQAAATFAVLGPLLRPQLTILGFYMNDFRDNRFPAGCRHRRVLDDGTVVGVGICYIDRYGNLIRAPWTEATLQLARAGRLPPPNEAVRRIGNTRLGSLLLSLKDWLESLLDSGEYRSTLPHEIEETRAYLHALKDQAAAVDSQLLVLLIDVRSDLGLYPGRFEIAHELIQELDLPFIDTRPFIHTPDDFAPLPDDHWNNRGHQKIGALLSECVEKLIAGGALANCENVQLPLGAG